MPYKDLERKREYQSQWITDRRAEWFKDKACVLCGNTEDLELDHIDPDKKVSHRIWSWSAVRRESELVKCRVLCNKCHKAKSSREHAKGSGVGTAKLAEEEVRAIRSSKEAGRALGRRYGVDEKTIRNIRKNKTWGSVV